MKGSIGGLAQPFSVNWYFPLSPVDLLLKYILCYNISTFLDRQTYRVPKKSGISNMMLGKGKKNKHVFYPHFVHKGGGSMWIFILFYNIIIKC